jgi:hypothetical protein
MTGIGLGSALVEFLLLYDWLVEMDRNPKHTKRPKCLDGEANGWKDKEKNFCWHFLLNLAQMTRYKEIQVIICMWQEREMMARQDRLAGEEEQHVFFTTDLTRC